MMDETPETPEETPEEALDGSALTPRQALATTRRYQAFEMLLAGASSGEIADALGVHRTTVQRAIARELQDLAERTSALTDVYRELVLVRLDRLLTAVWDKAMEGKLPYVDRALKLVSEQGRLMGVYAPQKLESRSVSLHMNVPLSEDEIKAAKEALRVRGLAVDPVEPMELTDEADWVDAEFDESAPDDAQAP